MGRWGDGAGTEVTVHEPRFHPHRSCPASCPVQVPYRTVPYDGQMVRKHGDHMHATRKGRESRGWDPVVVWREAKDGVTAVAVWFHLRRSSHRDPTLHPMLSCWPCRSVDRAPETARGVNAIHKRVVDGHDEHLARRLKVGMTDIARHMRRGA
jgi:hypothetical protein